MISEFFLNAITGVACGMTASSLFAAYKSIKKKKKERKKCELKLEEQLLELKKLSLELEDMKKEIELGELKSEDKRKYEDIKISINNLIEQYKNMI